MFFQIGKFKLKTGFFKTEPYDMFVCDKKITLISTVNTPAKEITINNDNLISISINNRNLNLMEMEILSCNDIYIGNLVPETKCEEIQELLIKKFENKIRLDYVTLDYTRLG